jgi:anti-sigma factor RsiW
MTTPSSHVRSRPICEDPCADDIVALVDGELDPEPASRLRAHLATCPVCAAELLEATRLTAQISTLTKDP